MPLYVYQKIDAQNDFHNRQAVGKVYIRTFQIWIEY